MSANITKALSNVAALEENEQYDEAIQELLKLHEQAPNEIEVVKNLAMDYQVVNDADNAVVWWEKYKLLDPNDTISYSQLADLYLTRNKFEYYMNRAHIKIIEQKPGQAADDIKKAISNSDDEQKTFSARFMLANIYEVLKKNTDAIQEYLRLLETEKNADIYRRLTELYAQESDEDAIGLLETAVEQFPEEMDLKETLAKLYYKTGDLDKALNNAQDNLTKAKIYLELRRNDDAAEILNNTKINNDNAERYHALWAEYNYNLDNFDEALANLNELEKVSPNSPLLYQMRALLYEAKNDEYMSHLCWAKCYELKGQIELTIDELMLAHRVNPKDQRAVMSLINVYNRLNDNNSVIEFCEKLYKLDENNAFALQKLAEFYKNNGENEAALDFYEKLYLTDKSNMQYLKLLAYAYESVKDMENAKKAWQKYLERAPLNEETEQIKKKLAVLENSPQSYESSEGFLDKLMGFFSKR